VNPILGNACNVAIFDAFEQNKGSKVEAPAHCTWHAHSTEIGGCCKGGQFDFLDQEGNGIQRLDMYSLVQSFNGNSEGAPGHLLHDANEDQWYLFNETARRSIYQFIGTAIANGFLTTIYNDVPLAS